MDAPASGCASDLSRRSYNPLSTDNAAASYRDRSRGSLSFRSPPPRSRGPRGHRCRCRLFKQRDASCSFFFRYMDGYNSSHRFFHVGLRCRDFDVVVVVVVVTQRSGPARCCDRRQKLVQMLVTQIYIRERDSRGQRRKSDLRVLKFFERLIVFSREKKGEKEKERERQ